MKPVSRNGEAIRAKEEPVRLSCMVAGLLIAFVLPIQPGLEVPTMFLALLGLSPDTASGVAAIAYEIGTALLIVALVRYWEHLPLSSIGIGRFSIGDAVAAVLVFFADLVVTPKIWALLQGSTVLANAAQSLRAEQEGISSWPILIGVGIAISISFAEEFGARAYAIERLSAAIGNRAIGAGVAFIAALSMHVPRRGLAYLPIVAPGQLLLVLLYLWRRNTWSCVLAHLLMDTYAMVIEPLLPLATLMFLKRLGI